VELVERLVLALTNEGDVVLDAFGGVGSSVVAAVKHRRMGIMCEQELRYIETAKERLRDYANGTLKLRPLGQPVYEPPRNGLRCG
jgi:DNA modification methylase